MFGSTEGRAQARLGARRKGGTTIAVSTEGSVRPASSTDRLEYGVQHRGKSTILPLVDVCVGHIPTSQGTAEELPLCGLGLKLCGGAAPAWLWSQGTAAELPLRGSDLKL